MANLRYVAQFPESGNWLLVRLESGERVSLPYGLMVDYQGVDGGRENFNILEGVHKNKSASVKQKSPTQSYLTADLQHLPAGIVRFDTKSQILKFDNRGPFNAFSGFGKGTEGGREVAYTPVPAGSYMLAIPAYPSAQTRAAYGQWTRFHQSWFRIGLDPRGSRFLHAGEISDGCVTVRQFVYDGKPSAPPPPAGFEDLAGVAGRPNQGLIGLPLPPKPAPAISFDEIYAYLILRRLNDQAVGTLVVTADASL